MTTRESCMDVFKHELKSSEAMEDLFRNSEPDEIASACLELAQDLLENAEDDMKKKVILETTGSIAQATGSEELAEFAVVGMQKVTDGQS